MDTKDASYTGVRTVWAEDNRTSRSRLRLFVRAQLPFLIGTAFVIAVVSLATPTLLSAPFLIIGLVVIIVSSVLALVLPWERFVPDAVASIALADIVGVALIRTELIPELPTAGVLVMFPLLWLAYSFSRRFLVIAVAGVLFATSLTYVAAGVWPASPLEWAHVFVLPGLSIGVAVTVHLAANQLRRNQRALRAASIAQAAALRQSQNNELLSRAILDTVNAAVSFYGPDNKPHITNKLATELITLAGIDLETPPYGSDNVLDADRSTPIPHEQQIIPRALRGEIVDQRIEWVGPADQQVAVMASSRRVYRDDGELLGTLIAAYDITELAHAIDIREQFLTTVSHELRTPLTNISGYLELLEDSIDPTDADSLDYLAIATRNTHTLHGRITELLTPTDATAPLATEPTDIHELLERAIADSRSFAAEQQHQIVFSHERSPRSTVQADQCRLHESLSELLHNAIKFSPPKSRITLTMTEAPGSATIAITNPGPGISRGEQARIFDRFYRTPHARNNAIQGFGLGLTRVHDTVTAHDGHISLCSSPHENTTFTITLPTSRSGLSDERGASPLNGRATADLR